MQERAGKEIFEMRFEAFDLRLPENDGSHELKALERTRQVLCRRDGQKNIFLNCPIRFVTDVVYSVMIDVAITRTYSLFITTLFFPHSS